MAVVLAKKLSEILKQMREGELDFQMAKSEVEAIKAGNMVIRNGFGNMVTKMPSIESQFALVLQHFAASFHEKDEINFEPTAALTFSAAKDEITSANKADFDKLILVLLNWAKST